MKGLFSRFIILVLAISIIAGIIYWNKSQHPKVLQEQEIVTKEEFGKLLFEDKRLSRDNSTACISCHNPEKAFTDGKIKSLGIGGKMALRNAPSLFNVKDAPRFMFDGAVPTLEMQAIVPIQDLNEMGFTMGELVEKLKQIKIYSNLSKSLYKRELDAYVITRALARYERTLISNNSKFDKFKASNYTKGFNDSEKRGWEIFSKELKCIECHALPNFTNYSFQNNHLTSLTEEDQGRFRITGNEKDIGVYKVPSLRNIALTAPYMHNGSYTHLEEIIIRYNIELRDANYRETHNAYPPIQFINDLKNFLYTLTDSSLVKNQNVK